VSEFRVRGSTDQSKTPPGVTRGGVLCSVSERQLCKEGVFFASGFRVRQKLFELGPLTQSAIVPRFYFKPGRDGRLGHLDP
jgi:hypothetical protein